ncbi:ornithine--oxo-acid transaminase [Geomicrobium sp. JCM 19038]|uniref:ornithine--oxo-acid transaminase n=1 Tax=Geomicrobium sp. JCM 19038 TaxID=1460635 RepID=UPI00045F22E4|nr:ornithine--oxo-acid transaminase [Geomicrobium sp. JCM 19038]GAK06492.1 ornithine aminotransferase [Geomicrobium sp. JCM 19038]
MSNSKKLISQHDHYGAPNYHPLPVVISEGTGSWVKDADGNEFLDMLSAYSAVNQGHRHPKIIDALKAQADRLTLSSRAFHNDQIGPFYEKLSNLTGKNKILPMNTGAEAVETAIKAARRWGYRVKGIANNQAEIIVCTDNFHGRTLAAVSLSSNEEYQKDFGPLLPGIKVIPYGDIDALKAAITENTAAFMFEPVQGEAGILIPSTGFLQDVRELCTKENVLMIADEIQCGLARTGKMFACEHENVTPDLYILGKALGGGVMPISAVCGDEDVLNLFEPGSHGSTFGGNPLACAVSIAAMDVIIEEDLAQRAEKLGNYFMDECKKIKHPAIKEVRGKGLFIGIELHEPARKYCESLMEKGMLCKETHENVLRLAPPLTISKEDLDFAIAKLNEVFAS